MPVYDDINDGLFKFEFYGKCLLRPMYVWDSGVRTDIILIDESSDTPANKN